MQRVRIGLTGLAAVFLLVLLAAALFGLTPADRSVELHDAAGNAAAEEPTDPLAELGVTPGGQPADEATPAATEEGTTPTR